MPKCGVEVHLRSEVTPELIERLAPDALMIRPPQKLPRWLERKWASSAPSSKLQHFGPMKLGDRGVASSSLGSDGISAGTGVSDE
jgi:hypothetical protein